MVLRTECNASWLFNLINHNCAVNFLTEIILNPYSLEFSYPNTPKMCDPILVTLLRIQPHYGKSIREMWPYPAAHPHYPLSKEVPSPFLALSLSQETIQPYWLQPKILVLPLKKREGKKERNNEYTCVIVFEKLMRSYSFVDKFGLIIINSTFTNQTPQKWAMSI